MLFFSSLPLVSDLQADSAALGVEKVSELYRNCVQTLLKVYSDDDLVKLRDPELDSSEGESQVCHIDILIKPC